MRAAAAVQAARAPATIAEALGAAASRLRAAGIAEPRREARLILCHALGVAAEAVLGHPERGLTPARWALVAALVARRAERRPLAQVLGVREFWSLPFRVTEATLDPRPDSETVVAAALGSVADREAAVRVLDLGTGTGCLLLAILSELPRARGVGVDVSAEACAVARENAAALGLADRASFVAGAWGRGLRGPFDLVVANPPYVADAELAALAPEVAVFEPRGALSGGADGLAGHRALAPDLARLLAPGGRAVVEIGAGQGAAVRRIAGRAGLAVLGAGRDLAGHERCLVLGRGGADTGA